jgi:hypothetical protein
MKVYIKKLSTTEFKVELLHTYIIFLENRYKKKYNKLSDNIHTFMDSYLIKSNRDNIRHLVNYNSLYTNFQTLTLQYNKLQQDYQNLANNISIHNNNLNNNSSDFKLSNLNILRFM